MFNVRVYALIENDGKTLILREPFAGQLVNKFPGGGLEFGEGTIDCLEREFQEELNLKLESAEHFYTLDFYVESQQGNGQFLPIYYRVKVSNPEEMKILDKKIEEAIWVDNKDLKPEFLDLTVDRLVVEKFLDCMN